MRLVQVAKVLGMTGQELRKELTKVDFGVKPTDREIPDSLAQGVIRYIARVRGIEVDMDALFAGGIEPEGEGGQAKAASRETDVSEEKEEVATPGAAGHEVNVLRKLSLEGVPTQPAPPALGQRTAGSRSSGRAPSGARTVAAPQRPTVMGHQQQIKKKEGLVMLPAQITLKEFAEKTGVQVPQIMKVLMGNGIMATINQNIDYDTAAIVAAELGVQVQREEAKVTAEHLMSRNLEELLKDEPENLVARPPIVVVMGHVDHGKTSILDAIRKTTVAKGEAGGITQHIGAYQIEHTPKGGEPQKITFIDTPGHEAFAAMRARGAQVTDIVVLVVAADEGVKPTTVEAINHAKEANVPVLVAVNKIDKPGADPERVKGELAGYGLQTEEWGGTVPFVLMSAATGQGIETLLDSLVLMGQVADLKANPNRSAVATVVESHLDQSLGALATLIVNAGTLRVGDIFVCGSVQGKVRTMTDEHGNRLEEALPSRAVQMSGLHEVVHVGDILQVVSSDQKAKELIEAVQEQGDRKRTQSFADLVTRLSEGKLKQLKVVLKADAQGSLDAIRETLQSKETDEVTVKIIHAAIGSVTETDVMMASASEGIVLAFHVPVAPSTARAAEREGVKVREYDVIYALFDDIDALLKGLIVPIEDEKIYGHLEVKGVFMTKKTEQVIGGKVLDGIIKRLPFRMMRDGLLVGTGRITSLRKVDKDIKEAAEGTECGLRTESSVPVQEGDTLEVYLKEFLKKK